MKTMLIFFVLAISFSGISFGDDSLVKLVTVKHVGDDHVFCYSCNESGRAFEVEQRYNEKTKNEEVRFNANDESSEWIAQASIQESWNGLCQKACD